MEVIMKQKSSFPLVNVIVSFLGLALMAYLAYMTYTSEWALIFKLLLWLLFDGIVSLQVLLLALSIGKRDKNPHIDYSAIIGFNIFMLVLYGIGFIAYHVYFIMIIIDIFKRIF